MVFSFVRHYPEGIRTTVVMFKIWVTKLPHQIATVAAQRFFRAMKCSLPSSMAQGQVGPTNGPLLQGPMCPEERIPFPNSYQSPSRGLWPVESKWSIKDGQIAGDKFPEKPVVAAELQNSWFGKKALLVGTIIWHVLTWKRKLKTRRSYIAWCWRVNGQNECCTGILKFLYLLLILHELYYNSD